MFITALTSVRQLSLSWASPIQSTYPHPTSWRPIIILSTHLRLGLPSGLFPSGFPTKTLYTALSSPIWPHAQPISFFLILSPARYWVRSTKHLSPLYAISSSPPLPRPSQVQIFSSTPYSQKNNFVTTCFSIEPNAHHIGISTNACQTIHITSALLPTRCYIPHM